MKTARPKLKAIILAVFLMAACLPGLTYASIIGKITAVQGNVDIMKPGQERVIPVRLLEPVSEGDIVRTKSSGKAEITFDDESIIRIAPNSRLQITEYLMEGSKRKSGVMNLFRGKIRAVVSKSRKIIGIAFGEGERFEVRTPTAVAGVKGTDFFVTYALGITGVMVADGKIDVFNPAIPGQVVLVTTGNATTIAENQPPQTPRPVPDVEKIRHLRDTDPAEKPKDKDDEDETMVATATAEGVFGYEAPDEGTSLTASGGFADAEPDAFPVTETHPELLSDIFAPVITASGPPTYTNNSTAAFMFTFNEPVDVTYTMGSWGATSTATTSDTFSIASLAEGSYTLTVTATDAAGNITTTSYSWTTDYTPPSILNSTPPPSITNSSIVPMGLSSNEAVTYQYSTDSGATWTNGSATATPLLPEGINITLDVRAIDLAGNPSTTPLNYIFTTDYTAPASLALTGTPASITNFNSVTIAATATDANGVTYSYTLDGATVPDGNLISLTEGAHTFVAIATDGAGNASTTSYTWTTDYKAPTAIITPASASPYKAGTDLSTVNINLSSNETSTFSYSLTGPTSITGTGVALSLSPLAEGNYTLAVTATDTAGNPSSPASLSFDLSRYSLSGSASGDVSIFFVGVATGEVAGVSNQSWGGWDISITGSGGSVPSSTWTLYAGGTSSDLITYPNGSNNGYWFEIASGTTDTLSQKLSGTSTFKYLSRDRLGFGTGSLTGTYSANIEWYDYLLTDTGIGTYTETPLAWSGEIAPDGNSNGFLTSAGLYSLDTCLGCGWLDIEGNSTGLMGGAASPWTGATSATFMGTYNVASGIAVGPPYLWTPEIYSYNVNNSTYTTYDGGAYRGFVGGVWNADGTINAMTYSIYIDPSGNAGILKGSLAGNYYPGINMFEADGTWTPIQMEIAVNVGVSPVNLFANTNPSLSSYSYSMTSLGDFGGTGSITVAGDEMFSYDTISYSISGQNWGIWERILGGDYSYPGTPPDTWTLSTQDPFANTYTEGYLWSGNKIAGTTYGYGADITATPMTWISVGETIGTFDPTTWQAVQTGAWLDTAKFLGMACPGGTCNTTGVASTADEIALKNLNIPFAEVGKTTLSGTGSIGGSTGATVTMTDVTFFAYSNGAAPKIWATGDVQGTYTCTGCIGGGNIPISNGSNITADFNVQTFDNASTQTWTATVDNGNAAASSLSGYSGAVTFNGAAAGTIDTTSTFSGTAAGVAQ